MPLPACPPPRRSPRATSDGAGMRPAGRPLRRRWPEVVAAGPRPEDLPRLPQVQPDPPRLRRRWDFRPFRPMASRMERRATMAMETSRRLAERRQVEPEGPRVRAVADRESRTREDPLEVPRGAAAMEEEEEEGRPRPIVPAVRQKRERLPAGPRPTPMASRAGVPGTTTQQVAGPRGQRRLPPVRHSF